MSNAPPDSLSAREPEPGDHIGRFRVIRRLARGGMATVWEVLDEDSDESLALKLLLPLPHTDESHGRFRREFRALSRLNHPCVLQVHESGLHGDRPWFTMERLTGHDLRQEVERLKECPADERFARAKDIVVQVARALAYIHERGLVHRDVSPANIFVTAQGPVKLMDFGVVKDSGVELTAVGEVIGTVAYMAPEQISGKPIDARADLYALGAVLYLLLTGRRAFSAHTIHGYMEKHLHVRPAPPSSHVPVVPPNLEHICLRLLEKDPRHRFASATHLLHVLGDEQPADVLIDEFPERTVGRVVLTSRLREAVEVVGQSRKGQVVMLAGPSGQGKSRLVRLAEHFARRLGLPVAGGVCRPHDRPFAAFEHVYDALKPPEPREVLRDFFDADDEATMTERYPILAAFKDLVTESAPAVICIDDAHHADPATAELLLYLVRNTLERGEDPVLYLVTHDDSRSRLREQLEAFESCEVQVVEPLEASDVEELVVSWLGSSPAAIALAKRLHAESQGAPAQIVDMLHGLVDDGLVAKSEEGPPKLIADVRQISRSPMPMPPSLRQSLLERLAPMSEDAMVVGRVLGHARNRLLLDVLVDATPFEEERVMQALDELTDAGIVREQRSGDVEYVELSHSRFREVLVDGVPPMTQRDVHRALGEAIEMHHRGRTASVLEELAHHFEEAELWCKAYLYLVKTGQHHQQRSLDFQALEYLNRAVDLEARARPFMLLDDADHRLAEVYLAAAQARHSLGQLPEAVRNTERAQALARILRDPGLQSRVAAELGSQLAQQGQMEAAEEQSRLAIQRAEESGVRSLLSRPLYQLGAVLWTRGDLNRADELWRRALDIAESVGDERAVARGYNGLGVLAICRGQSLDARRWLEKSAEVFERLGMLAPLVITRVNLIELYLNSGALKKALALADRTLAQAEEVSHGQGIALGWAWRGRILLVLGRIQDAAHAIRTAGDHLGPQTNWEDKAFVISVQVRIHFATEITETTMGLLDELETLFAAMQRMGWLVEVRAWRIVALSRLGRRGEAEPRLDALKSATGWPQVTIRADLALGDAQHVLGRRKAARDTFARALTHAEANGYRYLQLQAHRALLDVVDDEGAKARHLRVAAGLAKSLAANLPREEADRFLVHHRVG
ncbi:MAG: protein kinase [Myxococcota bacterium]